jgi:hypothetical protein
MLYRQTDPTFAGVLEEHVGIAAIAHAGGMDTKPAEGSPAVQTGRHRPGLCPPCRMTPNCAARA